MSLTSSNDSPRYPDLHGGQSDHRQGPPRKRMRKGTKSCLECRRRKIKCIFETGRTAICNECYARGSTCIDQEHGDVASYSQTAAAAAVAADSASYSLRERVSQLEDLVRRVLHKVPEKDASTADSAETSVDAQAAEVLKSLKDTSPITIQTLEESIYLPGGLREDAPALTLFDNAVISRRETAPEISRAQYNKSKALVAALSRLLPSPRDLDLILESASRWFAVWRQMFPEITDRRCESIKEAISHSLRSDSPAEIAKTMLCIAISVHQMPVDFDWKTLHLRDDPKELTDRYINTINQLITHDDEIAATIEGIECMALEAKYHINMGRPRRAWLLFHRAIAFSQLLGLHRLSSRKTTSSDDAIQYQRQVSLWAHLFMGDRYLSLVLGLPYSVSEAFCTPYIPPLGTQPLIEATEGEIYVARLCPLVTKIVDRNQSPTPIPYSATLRIDQELEEVHGSVPASWWMPQSTPGATIEEQFDRLQAQFFHHQVRTLLHMPFMLKSSADKRYQYSHQAALDSSREMIKCYGMLRREMDVGPYFCKLVDFQAFTAAMLLLLNLCGYGQHVRGAVAQQPDLDRDLLDSELIDATISNLHAASDEAGGIVAAQSAKALEMLAKVRHGCDEEKLKECQQQNQSCQVSIPYFGTITLALGKSFVPIKKGTYPQPSAASVTVEPRKSSIPAVATQASTGLPTPPSLSSNSTQPSPVTHSLDSARGFYGAGTDYIAPGLSDQTYNDIDPFVTFESFMAFPPQEVCGAGDMSTNGSTSGPDNAPQSLAGTMGQFEPNMAGGFPFGASGNVDLDHGWNWSGDLSW